MSGLGELAAKMFPVDVDALKRGIEKLQATRDSGRPVLLLPSEVRAILNALLRYEALS